MPNRGNAAGGFFSRAAGAVRNAVTNIRNRFTGGGAATTTTGKGKS